LKNILQKSKLFAGFDDSALENIVSASSLKKITKGEMIFYEKDPASAFFIVGDGKIKVFKLSSEGKEQILMIAKPGETFAEAALFGEGYFPASAQAMEDSLLLVVHRDQFVSLVKQNPNIALSLIARLSELLHKLNRLVEELSLTDITTRLAHYFINIIEEKKLSGETIVIQLAEKKTILASQLGTIPETLSRSLAKLSKENIITVDGGNIKINDIDRLYSVVEGS
jgi:CRP/FNR family transcriptional regulator